MNYLFGGLSMLFWPIIIIVVIVYFVKRRKGNTSVSQDKNWYLRLSLSKEDGVSQWLLLLSVFFLGLTLLSFNRDTGELFSWRAIILLTSLVGLICSYYFKVISTLLFSLIGVMVWWVAQFIIWSQGQTIQTSAMFAGISLISLIFFVLGHIHEKEIKYKRFAMVYLILGIISITAILFFISTQLGISVLSQMTRGVSFTSSWEITASLLIFFVTLIGTILYSSSKKLLFPTEAAAVLGLTVIFVSISLLPKQSMFITSPLGYTSSALTASGMLWVLLLNITVFAELLGLIFSGYIRKEEWLINLGAIFLFLLIIIKYFDWFFTFLDKSIFFIGAGILLFGVGWFMEKGRRIVVANISTEKSGVK